MERLKAGTKAVWDQYWGGTRQLWVDARAARALRQRVREIIRTDAVVALTRRETRFMRRVADDLRALVPFLAFFLLPGSAYALPIIVRLFPGFLPSTYHPPSYRIARMQKRQKAKADAAHKLRNALAERLRAMDASSAGSDRDVLLDLIQRAEAGETVPLKALRPLDRFFATRLRVWDLEPTTWSIWLCPQELRSLCDFYGISALPFPTYDHCANQLVLRASLIQHDDKEGNKWPTELTDEELLEASDERGLRTDVERDELVEQLTRWLEFRRPPPPVSLELTLFAPSLTTVPTNHE